MRKFEEIKQLLNDSEDDIRKFYEKGNAAAGTRVRGTMQELKKLAQEMRIEVQEMKNKAS